MQSASLCTLRYHSGVYPDPKCMVSSIDYFENYLIVLADFKKLRTLYAAIICTVYQIKILRLSLGSIWTPGWALAETKLPWALTG